MHRSHAGPCPEIIELAGLLGLGLSPKAEKLLVETNGSLEEVLLGIDQCPTCSKNLETLESWQDEVGYPCLAVVADERNRALELWQNLESLAAEELPEELGKEYRFWAMCRLLGEKARKEAHFSAPRAVRLAEIAVDLSRALDASFYSPRLLQDLGARNLAILGNTLRVSGDFCSAEAAFEEACHCLNRGAGGSAVRALVLFLLGIFKEGQLRLEEAFQLLEEAADLFDRCGDVPGFVRAQLALSNVEDKQNDLHAAIARVTRAQSLAQDGSDSSLPRYCQHQLVHLLVEAGLYEEARLRLDLIRGEESSNGSLTNGSLTNTLRIKWVEARIERGLGNLQEAEELLRAVLSGFSELGLRAEVGVAQLDLACISLERSREEEAIELCCQSHRNLEASGASRQALAAVSLALTAAKRREASRELFLDLVRYVSKPALQVQGVFKIR